MKKYLTICITLAAAVALCGCGDSKTSSKLIGTSVVSTTGSGASAAITATGAIPGISTVSGGFPLSGAQSLALIDQIFLEYSNALNSALNGDFSSFAGRQKVTVVTISTAPVTITPVILTGTPGGSISVTGYYAVNYNDTVLYTNFTAAASNFKWISNSAAYAINGNIVIQAEEERLSGTETLNITANNLSYSGGGVSTTVTMNVKLAQSTAGITVTGTVNGKTISGSLSLPSNSNQVTGSAK